MSLGNVKALKITAKDLGLKGYSKLNKSELIELLQPHEEQIKRLPPIITLAEDKKNLKGLILWMSQPLKLKSQSQTDTVHCKR